MLSRNISGHISHATSIRLNDIRRTKIKSAVDHNVDTNDVATKPLATWLINFAIEKAMEHNNKEIEVITNMQLKKGDQNG